MPVEEWLTRLGGDDLAKLQRLSDLLVAGSTLPVWRRRTPSDWRRTARAGRRTRAGAAERADVHRGRHGGAPSAGPGRERVGAAEPGVVAPRHPRRRSARFVPSGCSNSSTASTRMCGPSAGRGCANRRCGTSPAIWHRLIESPYDDIRGPLVAALDTRSAGADPDAVRLLWATVLLNITRGGRYKPGVVARIVAATRRPPRTRPTA